MSEQTDQKRPGGLTALAVLNFIFGGLGAIGLLALVALYTWLQQADAEAADEAQKAIKEAFGENTSTFLALIALSVVSTVLMIASGVGYLKQKKFLGRTLGNSYAILSIASTLASATQMPVEAGGGFNLGTIIGLIYPVLTLALLNSTFKHDFIR